MNNSNIINNTKDLIIEIAKPFSLGYLAGYIFKSDPVISGGIAVIYRFAPAIINRLIIKTPVKKYLEFDTRKTFIDLTKHSLFGFLVGYIVIKNPVAISTVFALNFMTPKVLDKIIDATPLKDRICDPHKKLISKIGGIALSLFALYCTGCVGGTVCLMSFVIYSVTQIISICESTQQLVPRIN